MAAGALALVGVAIWLRTWRVEPGSVFAGSGDLIWIQAMTQSFATVGPFGTDPHLAWPTGTNQWSFPQLGLYYWFQSWVLQNVFGLSSSLTVVVSLAIGASLTAMSALFLFRSVIGRRLTSPSIVAAFLIGASPFFIGSLLHLNLAYFFLVPLVIGMCVRLAMGTIEIAAAVVSTAAASAASPLWWVLVCLALLSAMSLLNIVARSRIEFRSSFAMLFAVGVGAGIQFSLYLSARIDGALRGRTAWDSNTYGGHLVDLLLASPLANRAIPALQELTPGASAEFKPLGLVPGMAASLAFVLILIGVTRGLRYRTETRVLAAASVAALLFFLAGGLGNLTAGLAVLIGTESPARVWARLSIVLSLLGFAWGLSLARTYIDKSDGRKLTKMVGRWTALTVACIALASWCADAIVLSPTSPLSRDSFADQAAVEFLRASREPCPIAQLPQNGVPTARQGIVDPNNGDFAGFPGLVPYVMAPEFYWSTGSWVPGKHGGLDELPAHPSKLQIDTLGPMGYCAILFDRLLAEFSMRDGTLLEGSNLDALGEPDFHSARYDVYLLPRGETFR